MRINTRYNGLLTLAVGAAAVTTIGLSVAPSVHAQDDPSKPAYFTEKVKPILDTNCSKCHGGDAKRGTFNYTTQAGLYKGGHHGNGIVPGKPEESMVIKLIRHEGPADDPMPMPPPPRDKVSDADIATITKWVKAGAVMPPDAAPMH